MIVLPREPVKVTKQHPKNLIIFSKPKVGKTTLISALPRALLLDFEDGSDFVEAQKLKVTSFKHLQQIVEAVKKEPGLYEFGVIDTITGLEKMCESRAEEIYMNTSMGVNWIPRDASGNIEWEVDSAGNKRLPLACGKVKYKSILNLANGGGYMYLRLAVEEAMKLVNSAFPKVIIFGHVKETQLEKNGAEFTGLELDLTGKIKRIMSANSDAIGYMYRKGNSNIINFSSSDEIICGARPAHLKNQSVIISEIDDENVLSIYWDRVFPGINE
jgi:hypothetical protein